MRYLTGWIDGKIDLLVFDAVNLQVNFKKNGKKNKIPEKAKMLTPVFLC